MVSRSLALVLLSLSTVFCSPSRLQSRQAYADYTVYINSIDDYCLILPRDANTDVGASEYAGGMASYCTNPQIGQGALSTGFWQPGKVAMSTTATTGRSVQLTGCINPTTTDRLNPMDHGGQYDSNGGPGAKGNPAGSVCLGYSSYVEIVEPVANRACIRCCDDPADCPVTQDTLGCPNLIAGEYFDCGF